MGGGRERVRERDIYRNKENKRDKWRERVKERKKIAWWEFEYKMVGVADKKHLHCNTVATRESRECIEHVKPDNFSCIFFVKM